MNKFIISGCISILMANNTAFATENILNQNLNQQMTSETDKYVIINNDLQGTWTQCDDRQFNLCEKQKAVFGATSSDPRSDAGHRASMYYQENIAKAEQRQLELPINDN
jgi:hypothetical protein